MNLAKKGFTLIELLVVIAIIGILAAIILPVYAQARKAAFRNSDMSSMDQLRSALQLYKTDQGAYPPALLGYVTLYEDGSLPNLVPASQVQGSLYPKRVNTLNTFQPAMDRTTGSNFNTLGVNPVWPNGELGGVGNGACAGNNPSTNCNLQRYGQSTPVAWCDPNDTTANDAPTPAYYYQLSGYDVATVTTSSGPIHELHYSPWWTGFTVPDTCNPSDAGGSSQDSPRQLGYSDPPDSTVVTWDSWFRDYENGAPIHQKQDIVLFLGGDARPYDSANVAAQAWQVTP